MADSVQQLVHVAESIEEMLKEHLQRPRLKRLFSLHSDERRLKKCREKLQNALEILHVESEVEATVTVECMNGQLSLLQEMHQDLPTSQMDCSAPAPSSNSYSNRVAEFQTIRGRVTASNIRQYSVAGSMKTHIQDNSLVINGSGNNITMIVCGPHQNN